MKPKDLITLWSAPDPPRLAPKQTSIRLPMLVAAKISALCELYPKKTKTEIIGDLLTTALEQLERELPRQKGQHCMDHPDTGEPLYEEVGVIADYRSKTEKFLRELEKEAGITEPMEYSTSYVCSADD